MERDVIISTVNKALSEEFELEMDRMVPLARIREDLNLDSLDVIDMILALEQAFHFKLQDRSQVLNIRTLEDIYNFIETLSREGVVK